MNTFIWYELLTTEPDAAAAFYGSLLGWRASDSGQAGMDYRILSKEGTGIGGLMALPPGAAQAGMHPSWLGYVSVADVDQALSRIVAAGGLVQMPAMTIPGVGRLAMIADPQGALLYVMTPTGTGPATSYAPGIAGHGGWHELHTRDWEAALSFYQSQFGWSKVHALSMGPLGSYLQFNYGEGNMVGGMMNDPQAARPYWLYVFNVDNIDEAQRRVDQQGGETLVKPHQVPNGSWVMHARDPQGARFALVGPRPPTN